MRYYTIEELSEPAKKLLRTKYTDKEQFGTKQIGLAIRKMGYLPIHKTVNGVYKVYYVSVYDYLN